ncbi:MAG TPA: zf-HC2 domain-containing protein [Longimicrobiales bacterium]|nr:zf-HC2 domain-containing protein [Longimicrobiales bacterium]
MRHPAEDTLQAYVDGELEGAPAEHVGRHVATCIECRGTVARLREASALFSEAMGRLDAGEPAAWADENVLPLALGARTGTKPVLRVVPGGGADRAAASAREPERAVPRAPGVAVAWRWAAAILLVTAAAGSAAIVAFPILRGGGGQPGEALTAVDESVASGAGVVVRPLNGVMDIAVRSAPAGSRLVVELTDERDVRVDVSGAAAPRFEARDGSVVVDLADRSAVLRVSLPRSLAAGTVRVDDVVVARSEGDRVVPEEALEAGIPIPVRP